METRLRSIAKTVTWQLSGLVSTSAIAFLFTGSLGEAGAVALASMAVATVCYVLHERAWNLVRWGRYSR